MSKLAIITDIHFDLKGGNQFYLNKYREFFEKQFFPYLKQHNIKTVLIGGDTWENRKSITINALHHAKDMFFDKLLENDISVYSILGNHDVVYKNTNEVNSIQFIEDTYSNFTCIYKNDIINFDGVDIGFVSWINSENYNEQIKFIKSNKCEYLLGHFEINGFEMTKGHSCEDGLVQSLFNNYKSVWSGHFHIRNKIGNIEYLGNPFQTNRGDLGHSRGFSVFDTNTKELRFVENQFNIYEAIYFKDDFDLKLFNDEYYKNKIVLVYVYNLLDANIDLLNVLVDKLNSVSYTVEVIETKTISVNNIEVDDVEIKTHQEIIIDYVDTVLNDAEYTNDVKNIMLNCYNDCINLED